MKFNNSLLTRRDRISGGTGLARDVFIFAGQSNVDAFLFTSSLEPEYQQVYTGVNFYQYSATQNVKFTPLWYGSNPDYQNPNQTARYAMQFILYPQLKTLLSKDNIYIVHHAQGGTSLSSQWKSTATVGALYNELVFKTKATINLFNDVDGVTPNIRFIYWGQGETDAARSTDASNYQTNLTNLVNNFRTAVGMASLPFLVGRLNQNIDSVTFPFWNTVRTAQTNVAGALSNVFLVNQDNAEMAVDNVHYTTSGYTTISSNIISVAQANGLI